MNTTLQSSTSDGDRQLQRKRRDGGGSFLLIGVMFTAATFAAWWLVPRPEQLLLSGLWVVTMILFGGLALGCLLAGIGFEWRSHIFDRRSRFGRLVSRWSLRG